MKETFVISWMRFIKNQIIIISQIISVFELDLNETMTENSFLLASLGDIIRI